jgi:hypothetical protein
MLNCSSYKNELDFSECKLIEKILLTGSGVDNIALPRNGFISELRLPQGIKKLILDNHPLTEEKFSIGTYDYGAEGEKIGDGKGRYVNNYSNLQEIEIINTPIDSYTLVNNAHSLSKYKIIGFNWNITSKEAMKESYVAIDFNTENDIEFDSATMYVWDPSQ